LAADGTRGGFDDGADHADEHDDDHGRPLRPGPAHDTDAAVRELGLAFPPVGIRRGLRSERHLDSGLAEVEIKAAEAILRQACRLTETVDYLKLLKRDQGEW
jgi:hypothetical protein